jgi:hypothetical protein
MLSATDELQGFREGARAYFSNIDQKKRRFGLTAFAKTFGADRTAMKRLLRFWGIVNDRD